MASRIKLNISLEEMIKVIKEEAVNLKNAGDIHRAYILRETADFLIRQKRNGIKNE
jgi:hypothetical protein